MPQSVRVLHVCGRMKPGGITRFVESVAALNPTSSSRHDLLLTFANGPEPRRGAYEVHRLNFGSTGAVSAMTTARRLYRQYDAIMIHGPHPVAVLPLIGLGKRVLLFQHGLATSARIPALRALKKRWFSAIPWLADADTICSTEFARRKSEAAGVRFRDGRVHIVPFGTDMPRRREAPSREPGTVTIGVAGRLDAQKRPHLVLESLALFRGRHRIVVLIAGDGPDRSRLEALAAALRQPQVDVCFLGNVEDMAGFYDRLDLLAFPSTGESFGLVAAEALMRSVPVAVFRDVGGCLPLVRPGETGFIAADGADGLRQLWEALDRDPGELARLREQIGARDLSDLTVARTRDALDTLAARRDESPQYAMRSTPH